MTPLEERVSRLEGGHEHLATKADVADVRTSIAELRTSMAELRAELLERIASGENRHIRWTVGTALVGLSIAVAVIKLID